MTRVFTTNPALPLQGNRVKVHLHYGDYRSKLVHLESQKIFPMFKKALA